MAYQKEAQRKYRKRYRRKQVVKKPTTQNVSSAWSMAKNALYIAKGLKSLVNVEMKRFESNINGSVDNAGNNYYTLNSVPQGDTDGTRDGDSLKMHRIHVKGHFNIHPSSTVTTIRAVLFIDKQDTLLTAPDFWDNLTLGSCVDSSKHYDSRFESRVLCDKRFCLNTNQPNSLLDLSCKVGLHTQYVNGTTSIATGALKLMLISDITSAGNKPTFDVVSYLYYTDN